MRLFERYTESASVVAGGASSSCDLSGKVFLKKKKTCQDHGRSTSVSVPSMPHWPMTYFMQESWWFRETNCVSIYKKQRSLEASSGCSRG